ncbi:MAG: alpha/beta fold hydrolase [Burkholderiaceae bacterium]|nr:alpha/beta fold hydrolase [Burkholderiaceae bacterium]
MRAALKAALLGSATVTGPCAPVTQFVLERPEGSRHCLFGIPTAPAAGKRPLVIILHGAGASAHQVLGMAFPPSPLSLWLEIAEREHVIVAAPDAGQGGWQECFASAARVARKNDVAWIDAVIDHAIGALGADAQRVYLIGVSRGGWMAYRAAMEIPHRLAAFSAVLANMPPRDHAMQPRLALPALIVGATDDPLMPYGGGKYWYTLGFSAPVNSMEDSARVWRELAGLPDPPAVTTFPRRHPWDRTRSTLTLWGEAPDGLQVGLIRIEGGGHAEPSGSRRYPGLIGKLVGAQSADFEIAETAWAFFRDKRLARPAGQPVQRA